MPILPYLFKGPKRTRTSHDLLFSVFAVVFAVFLLMIFPNGEDITSSELPALPVTSDGPIIIMSDTDLANQASLNGWEGNGTVLDPYVIRDLDINGPGTAACLRIEQVSAHFVVTNCTLHHADLATSTDWVNAGLVLVETTNGTVTGNVIEDNLKNGIATIDSEATIIDNVILRNDVGAFARRRSAKIIDNEFSGNNQSVYSWESTVEVVGNTIDDVVGDKYSSIYLFFSDSSIVRGNEISNAKYAIQLRLSDSTKIESNKVHNSISGLWIWHGQNTLVKDNHFDTDNGVTVGDLYSRFYNNTFLGGGIEFAGAAHDLPMFNTHEIDLNNTYEGRPILFIKNQTGVAIDSAYGEIIVANCTDVSILETVQTECFRMIFAHSPGLTIRNNTIKTDFIRCEVARNMVISGNTFMATRIRFWEGSDDAMVDGNVLMDSSMWIVRTDGHRIYNNTISNQRSNGISLSGSNRVQIFGNSITVREPAFYSPAIQVSGAWNATFKNNEMYGAGIHMWSSYDTWRSHHIDETNTVNGHPVLYVSRGVGFNLSGVCGQVILGECRDFDLTNLTMDGTSPQIQMVSCVNGTITGCELKNNIVRYAIEARECENLKISNNLISSNGSCIYLYDCSGFDIRRNRISDSSLQGINLGESSGCTISENDIINSTSYGIYMYGSYNTVHLNNLFNNNRDPVSGEVIAPQCLDDGFRNNWSVDGRGNYWSDYQTKYPNASYSVDVWLTPYELDGRRGAVDEHPLVLMHDYIAPVVSQIQDMVVDQGENVTLQVEARDNVGIADVVWTVNLSGEIITLHGRTAHFTFSVPGTHQVTVTVADAASNTASSTFHVTVLDTEPPIARAGEDIVVDQYTEVVLDASASRDNVGIASLLWTVEQGDEVRTFDTPQVRFTFEVVGVHQVTLRVTDAAGNWDEAGLSVEVVDSQPPDIAYEATVTEALKGRPLTLTIEATDNIGVTGAFIILRYGNGPIQNLSMDPGYSVDVGIPRHPDGDDLTFHFSARDEEGNWFSTGEHTISLVNAAPGITDVPQWTITEGQDATLDLEPYLSDANDNMTDLTVAADDGTITVEGLVLRARYDVAMADWTVRLTVSDGEDGAEAEVVVHVVNVNDAPVIVSISPDNGTTYREGKTVTFTVVATDEEGDDLTVTWVLDGKTLGTGTTIDYKELKPGTRIVKVRIFDGTETTEDEITLVIKKDEEGPGFGIIVTFLAMLAVVTLSRRHNRT